ncbi:MAG: hypothetical protein J0I07_26215 [Myxococcales bacterium]|nr:hypothetical protein [Myxococcales bacterium]
MSIDSITNFVREASFDPSSYWDYAQLERLAGLELPHDLLGDQATLLKADQHRLWLKWFLEGLASPSRIAGDSSLRRLDIFEAVLGRVTQRYPMVERHRRAALAEKITDHLEAEVDRIRLANSRDHATSATRQALISASAVPRCYICGYAFSQEAIDAFRRVKGREKVKTPLLVDVLRPRGLVERDITIEIEHVVPVAQGGSGQGNLKLACGWCNKHKSSRVSLYEAPFVAPKTLPFVLGSHRLHELPSPFWTIRVMALRGRCQHVDDCDCTAENAELFISLADWTGSPNPTNLVVHCKDHDPIATHRMVDCASAESIWNSRR